jgi:hypothetical protein
MKWLQSDAPGALCKGLRGAYLKLPYSVHLIIAEQLQEPTYLHQLSSSPLSFTMGILKGPLLPYRDINVQVADSAYTFTSPSSPDAPALVIDRPTGDIHLDNGRSSNATRPYQVMSINGILGIIQLRLGAWTNSPCSCASKQSCLLTLP